jgi:hypothetical protein
VHLARHVASANGMKQTQGRDGAEGPAWCCMRPGSILIPVQQRLTKPSPVSFTMISSARAPLLADLQGRANHSCFTIARTLFSRR